MKTFLTFFVLLFSSSVVAEWTLIAHSDYGDSFFVEYDTIKKENEYVYYWELVNYPSSLQDNIYSAKNYFVLDCKKYLFKFLKDIYFSEEMGKGKIISQSEVPDEFWRDFNSPGSSERFEQLAVCKYAN
jgi:hypothetical protein